MDKYIIEKTKNSNVWHLMTPCGRSFIEESFQDAIIRMDINEMDRMLAHTTVVENSCNE